MFVRVRLFPAILASMAATCGAAGRGSEVNLNALAMVHGAIYYRGGPLGSESKSVLRGPETGNIKFVSAGEVVAVTASRRNLHYAVGPTPGRYSLRTESGSAYCVPATFTACQATIVTLNVTCDVV